MRPGWQRATGARQAGRRHVPSAPCRMGSATRRISKEPSGLFNTHLRRQGGAAGGVDARHSGASARSSRYGSPWAMRDPPPEVDGGEEADGADGEHKDERPEVAAEEEGQKPHANAHTDRGDHFDAAGVAENRVAVALVAAMLHAKLGRLRPAQRLHVARRQRCAPLLHVLTGRSTSRGAEGAGTAAHTGAPAPYSSQRPSAGRHPSRPGRGAAHADGPAGGTATWIAAARRRRRRNAAYVPACRVGTGGSMSRKVGAGHTSSESRTTSGVPKWTLA